MSDHQETNGNGREPASPDAADLHMPQDREATPDLRDRDDDRRRRPRDSRRDEETTEDREDRRKRRRENETEEDREERRRRRDTETEEEREERRRRRENETEEEREERRRRRENETEEEREERRRRRRDREREHEKPRSERDGDEAVNTDREGRARREDSRRASRRERSGSRDSYRSHRSHRSHRSSYRDYDDDRRATADDRRPMDDRRRRDELRDSDRYDNGRERDRRYYDEQDRERDRYDRRRRDSRDIYGASPMRGYPPSPPRRRRDSFSPGPIRRRSPSFAGSAPPPPGRSGDDEAEALLNSVDSETRSVFVSQLAAALTSRDVGLFFEQMLGKGSVKDARVVTDRVTRRSKGIAYVELSSVDLVQKAIALTGTLVMGLPIMVTLTESERNAQPPMSTYDALSAGVSSVLRPAVPGSALPANLTSRDDNADAPIPHFRLYVGNLYYNLTAEDLRQVFEPFGELAFVDMPLETGTSRSRGYAFVQYKELLPAQMALQSMNGFELAGRQIKVATVHPKGTGPVANTGTTPSQPVNANYSTVGAPAQVMETLDDAAGTRLDATTRQSLMYKLARQADPNAPTAAQSSPYVAAARQPYKPAIPQQQTQYVQVTNMFDPAAETEPNWHLDLEEDVKDEVEGKYGKLAQIHVDTRAPDGNIYMKFVETDGAAKAIQGLNGRFFAGRKIVAISLGEALYKAQVPAAK